MSNVHVYYPEYGQVFLAKRHENLETVEKWQFHFRSTGLADVPLDQMQPSIAMCFVNSIQTYPNLVLESSLLIHRKTSQCQAL